MSVRACACVTMAEQPRMAVPLSLFRNRPCHSWPKLLDKDAIRILIILGSVIGFFILVIILAVFTRYFRLWIQSVTTGAGIGIFDLLGMTFRKVNPAVIVRSKIMAVQAGIGDEHGVTSQSLEAHYLAGGNVPLVVRALIAAAKAKLVDLNFKLAAAIDLAGRNVLEAVQTSVNPKVIDCPGRGMGKESLDGVAQNGIQLKVQARVTVRTNLRQLIGGATEETIIARVGEGIVSAIGSAKSHLEVLANPDRISKTVLGRRLDAQTAFEIVSIDIADMDVGENIGARLASRPGRGRHARGPGECRRPPRHGRRRGAGNDRPDRRKPGQSGRGRSRGAQGHRPSLPHQQTGIDGLLSAPQHPGRHRHASVDRQSRHEPDRPENEQHGMNAHLLPLAALDVYSDQGGGGHHRLHSGGHCPTDSEVATDAAAGRPTAAARTAERGRRDRRVHASRRESPQRGG